MQIADELGILIWHDMMYACSMYPADSVFLSTVSKEIRQQVRRLSRHPSVLIWAGNNENEAALRDNWSENFTLQFILVTSQSTINFHRYGTASKFELYKQDYIKLYVDTIRTIVREEDPSRPFSVSSPSNGKRSEEEGYIAQNPGSQEYGDGIHAQIKRSCKILERQNDMPLCSALLQLLRGHVELGDLP